MTKNEAKVFQTRAQAALDKEFGPGVVSFSTGVIGTGGVELKFKFKAGSNETERDANAQTAFAQYADLFGLNASDYGRSFIFKGRSYKVTSINSNKPKFCIATIRDDGTPFNFPSETVIKYLNA